MGIHHKMVMVYMHAQTIHISHGELQCGVTIVHASNEERSVNH